jgi:hypothetical protein
MGNFNEALKYHREAVSIAAKKWLILAFDTGGESLFLKQPSKDEQSEHVVSEQAVLRPTTYPFAAD